MPSKDKRYTERNIFVIRRKTNPTAMDYLYAQMIKGQKYSWMCHILLVNKIIINQHPKLFTHKRYEQNLKDLGTAWWIHDRVAFTKHDLLSDVYNGYKLVATNKLLKRFMDYGWVDYVSRHRGGDDPQQDIFTPTSDMKYKFQTYYKWLSREQKIPRTRTAIGDLMDDRDAARAVMSQNRDVDDRKENVQIFQAKKR